MNYPNWHKRSRDLEPPEVGERSRHKLSFQILAPSQTLPRGLCPRLVPALSRLFNMPRHGAELSSCFYDFCSCKERWGLDLNFALIEAATGTIRLNVPSSTVTELRVTFCWQQPGWPWITCSRIHMLYQMAVFKGCSQRKFACEILPEL